MTAVSEQVTELRAIAGGGSSPAPTDRESALAELTELLALGSVGLAVTGSRIVGRGSSAWVDIYLSDGKAITFEKFSLIAEPKKLATEVVTCTSACPTLKGPDAVRVMVLLRHVAEFEETETADQVATTLGLRFLQEAESLDVDMNDGEARWRAFCRLFKEGPEPSRVARETHTSVATHSTILVHPDGTRFIPADWFYSFWRGEEPGISKQQVGLRMRRVGWGRRGTEGRINARRPGFEGQINRAFYVVAAGWEDEL